MRGRWIVLLCVLLVGALLGLRHLGNAAVDPRNAAPVEVQIPEGSGARTIASTLHDAGVLRSPLGFLVRVYVRQARHELRAGTYTFTRAESGAEMLRRLRKGDTLPNDISVTIPEGFTLRDIAGRLESTGIVSAAVFLDAARVERVRDTYAFLKDVPDGTLEGYVFPDTYRFFRNTPPEKVLEKFLKRFDEQFQHVLRETGGLQQHTVHDVVTMASIVEREVRSLEDRKMVAGVLWSRQEHGVGLAADATVRYAINTWDRPLTVQDLAIDSPYNTRRFAGLPPGPIGSPGVDSMRATLAPTFSDYFYYLSARDGRTIFSKTLEEHNRAVQEYLR